MFQPYSSRSKLKLVLEDYEDSEDLVNMQQKLLKEGDALTETLSVLRTKMKTLQTEKTRLLSIGFSLQNEVSICLLNQFFP